MAPSVRPAVALAVAVGLAAAAIAVDPARPRQDDAPTGGASIAAASASALIDTGAPTGGVWSRPRGVGRPYPGRVKGVITFRGNPTRTYYGRGPVPRQQPRHAWAYPRNATLCGMSIDHTGKKQWCGTGWTGQPAVFRRQGKTWLVFGAYDYAIHFLNAKTGRRLLPPFPTGDIIKGSVTIDPDGFPLVYSGSRDNKLRVIAFDRTKPRQLWRLSAYDTGPRQQSDDWDGSPLILGDYLFEGGENSRIHIVKLNRRYNRAGRVRVDPVLVWDEAGWDKKLNRAFGAPQTSIENSVAVYRNTLYFANSAGLVQGWDISGLQRGRVPKRVFRFWTGDDTDATITIDADGYLYVGSEFETGNRRSRRVGQMLKLDPRSPRDPVVWSVKDQAAKPGGVWGTPALHRGIVIYDTDGGRVLGVDRDDGEVLWQLGLQGPLWQSPVVVDDVLLLGDCAGTMHAFDVSQPRRRPRQLWQVTVGGCIESTPAVYNGRIYFGTRSGQVHALAPRTRAS